MKEEKNILVAFLLNLLFSIFEFFGGAYLGSIAIISDAIHDVGDAISIGIAFFLEKISYKKPNEKHTYGYARYSIIGAFITSVILLSGSVTVIINSVKRLVNPIQINYNGMIVFAIIGVTVNFCAAYFTGKGETVNQRAVNLHMLEDVLGWALVLIGAIIMKFTDFVAIDIFLSIGVAVFIIISCMKNLIEIFDFLLEKTPRNISVSEIECELRKIEGVEEVYHIHIWALNEKNHIATMHVIFEGDGYEIKEKIREKLMEFGVNHATLELEEKGGKAIEKQCSINTEILCEHHHHHH